MAFRFNIDFPMYAMIHLRSNFTLITLEQILKHTTNLYMCIFAALLVVIKTIKYCEYYENILLY